LLAPLAALIAVTVSGPTYTDAPNQGAMVVRFLALVIWFFVVSIGSIVTLLSTKQKRGAEYILFGCAALSSLFLFYAISTSMN